MAKPDIHLPTDDAPRWPKDCAPFRVDVKRWGGDRGAIRAVVLLDRHGDEWGRMVSAVEAERVVEVLNREAGYGQA